MWKKIVKNFILENKKIIQNIDLHIQPNFLIFYLSSRNYRRVDPREIHRKKEYKRKVNAGTRAQTDRNGAPIARHKCAVCGRTDLTNPELEFRFCSKCNGNYEYCQDHLFTHKHVL